MFISVACRGNESAPAAARPESAPAAVSEAAPEAKAEAKDPAPEAAQPTKLVKPAKVAAESAASKSKATSRTDVEITGLTSETTDQIYGRLSTSRSDGPVKWFIRTGYGTTKTRTYTKNKVNTTDIGTYNLDCQYRHDYDGGYRFVSAAANIRNRDPYTVAYGGKTGYYMLNAGIGRNIAPGLAMEFALASITRYEDDTDHRVTPVYVLRMKRDLTDAVAFDANTNLIQPFGDDALVDSRMNLTYKLTPAVSMRLTYVANNLLTPVKTRTGWDKSLRASLVFSAR